MRWLGQPNILQIFLFSIENDNFKLRINYSKIITIFYFSFSKRTNLKNVFHAHAEINLIFCVFWFLKEKKYKKKKI